MSLANTYSLRRVCRLLGVALSSVYYAAAPSPDETMVRNALLDLAEEWPTYGYRRLTAMMRRLDWTVNAKRVRRLMTELNLGAKRRRRACGRPTVVTPYRGTKTSRKR